MRPYKAYRNKLVSGRIYKQDAIDFLRSIERGTGDIVFLDPPFNLGKKYDHKRNNDQLPETEYKLWLMTVLNECIRVLRPGGALYLYHLPKWAMRLGWHLEEHLDFRHWISVSMKGGFARGRWLYPAHYALLYFTKGEPTHFQRPKLQPVKCRHCRKHIKDYGGYKKIVEEKGLNLSDCWDDLSPVRHNHRKNRRQNELPSRFMERVIAISGTEGGVYIDPFAGSGTGVIEAIRAGMTFVASDILQKNCSIVEQRIRALPTKHRAKQ